MRATTTRSRALLGEIEPDVIVQAGGGRARRAVEQGPVQHVRPQPAHAGERARLRARRRASSTSSSSPRAWSTATSRRAEVGRGPPARADRHLRRAQGRRREDRDRLQPGLRPPVHDRPALGALRAALRQPPRRARSSSRARSWARTCASTATATSSSTSPTSTTSSTASCRDRSPRTAPQRDLQHDLRQGPRARRELIDARQDALPRDRGRVRRARPRCSPFRGTLSHREGARPDRLRAQGRARGGPRRATSSGTASSPASDVPVGGG